MKNFKFSTLKSNSNVFISVTRRHFVTPLVTCVKMAEWMELVLEYWLHSSSCTALQECSDPSKICPLPSYRHRQSNDDCMEGKRENYQVCSVQYCVQNCAQCNAHTYEQI